MNDTDRETDPQRGTDVGQGYPEEGQPGTGIDPREHAEDEATPDHDAPQSQPGRDSDPSHATGNPRAAGG